MSGPGLEMFQDPWFLHRFFLTLLVFALLAAGHIYATKSHRLAGLKAPRSDHHLKFNEELQEVRVLQTRIEIMKKVHAFLIHFEFPFNLATFGKLIYYPSFASFCEALTTLTGFLVLLKAHELIKTHFHFRIYEALCFAAHMLFTIGMMGETDLLMFDMAERLCTLGAICTSLTFIDIEVTVPFFFCQSVVLTYCRWNLIGFDQITPTYAFGTMVPHIVAGGVIVLCTHLIRSNVEANLDSGEASTLMMGFRQILRGVCDGGFILDRRSMTIVDDASCLERVLKSNRTLTNSNFFDLFLDSESREQFCQFVGAEDQSAESSMPRGLRVSLQGATGAVSMDLFYAALPQLCASNSYCLLAMREDPEQSAPPEAPPDSVPSIQAGVVTAPSRSSVSELVAAYDDLIEIALLVSDATGFLDVEEAHLSFQRTSDVSNIESGMPTLRKFIRPSDWDRIEQMFNIVTNLPASEQRQRCHFQRPTLFRVPGESRSYLCARSTSLSLADEAIIPGRPSRFWMHLTQFDSSQISRPPQPELEGIAEEQ